MVAIKHLKIVKIFVISVIVIIKLLQCVSTFGKWTSRSKSSWQIRQLKSGSIVSPAASDVVDVDASTFVAIPLALPII